MCIGVNRGGTGKTRDRVGLREVARKGKTLDFIYLTEFCKSGFFA